jgi:transcriptional regulator with XRE-family HTH domain
MASVSERHPGGRPRTVRRCELGQRIEKLAAAKGLHIDEVARAAGISTPGLYRILTGEISSPRLSTVKALASALGVKLEKLA